MLHPILDFVHGQDLVAVVGDGGVIEIEGDRYQILILQR